MKYSTRQFNPKKCARCGRGVMSHLHFFPQAGHHRFVPEHKHVYAYKATTGMMLRTYHFECKFDGCYHRELISKHVFWHGQPKRPVIQIPTVDYSQLSKKVSEAFAGFSAAVLDPPDMTWKPDVIQTPPHGNPSSHYTVRSDGTIEDHTPWLDMRPKNNEFLHGVEFDGETHLRLHKDG